MQNIWRYFDRAGQTGGIVEAETQEEAEAKALAYIKGHYSHDPVFLDDPEPEVIVWPCLNDDDYDERFPGVLAVY